MASHLDKLRLQKQEKKSNPFVAKGSEFKESQINPEMSEQVPETLEELENQIEKLYDKIQECGWLIGMRLIAVRDHHLNEMEYLNIADYAFDKFQISKQTTYNLIFVAGHFTKEQSQKLGSKLYLLQSLNDSKRQDYLEWINENNPSRREIEEKIKSEQKRVSRPKQDISLRKTRLVVDFKKMGIEIPKEDSQEFLKELHELINKWSHKEAE